MERIQPDLIIPTGKRKGHSPSVASIYRALAEHKKAQAYPEAVEAAQADFTALRQRSATSPTSARPSWSGCGRPCPTRKRCSGAG
ncbi:MULTISPECIES: hypothetical protein [unclassified Streptomyces]|uniref:Uncharacterized protein n=1 Tax=Streptomyces sp. R28 TaxID=3238628 RepID=A0AB39QEE6_9ACTN|nr:hypothetical protein [Streptomyces sp. KN37]WPO73175.1 hypothetical protein R9806_22355 [Streptomyces sp. KN37]